jgi:23S rRNA (guanosine2251-2'-O)-methyltransferase
VDNSPHPVEEPRSALPGERYTPAVPLTVVLDDVRSLHNVGSVFRSADAFGLAAVWLVGITGRPPHRDIRKTALGADGWVPWRGFADRAEALAAARQEGLAVWALEQAPGSVALDAFRPSAEGPAALWLGHEVRGVDAAVLDAADAVLEIPQYGRKASLNVSVAAGVAMARLAGLWLGA